MASLTIRNIDDELKERLRVRAAQQGHSMEEEARLILQRDQYRTGNIRPPCSSSRETPPRRGLAGRS